jgi:hypothetical protein
MILVSGQRKYSLPNGFANTLTGVAVNWPEHKCITEPIENLDIKELFIWIGVLEILETEYLGGGRNLDFDVENTTEFAQTEIVQNKLEEL